MREYIVRYENNKFTIEEIVRCKDCIWRECDWEEYCSHNDAMVNITDDCYCSYGERKLKNPDDSLVTEDSSDCKEQKSKLESDFMSRQAAIDAVEKAVFKGVAKSAIESLSPVEPKRLPQPHKCVVYRDGECRYPIEACSECPKHEGMRAVLAERPKGEWVSCSEPPKDRRNVFLAHGTNDFKSCCIGHYEQGIGWYEDRNFFAKPIYDCKYWCDIPDLPDMGDNQFDMRGDKE